MDYYTRVERGKIAGVSEEVLESVARALRLDDIEHDHLLHLVRSMRGSHVVRRSHRAEPQVRPETQRVLDSIALPALIQNARLDILAANRIGWAVYPYAREVGSGTFNHLKFQLLDPRARNFYRDWELTTKNAVALLRAAAGRDPEDESISQLVGELSTHSERFRQLWASSHDVLGFRRGVKRYRHPLVGEIDFDLASFDLAGEPGLVMLVYSVQPGSPSADALQILANWSASSPAGFCPAGS
ncbi:hypothetical protein CLV30_10179 [Haloactinopolyspora alba]|uniref:MmyB-like transcription regulator ligand binding domain-containing protein n=1 Tax=Haloactinopolyspora alba TaxID=648780 RepID=A0A2P8EF64_9ACTN|nr:hypothetical protein CLV30_10179 [Haloactinopolyspora alba]